jgi:tetratricopeptide (TPR) repeat protein
MTKRSVTTIGFSLLLGLVLAVGAYFAYHYYWERDNGYFLEYGERAYARGVRALEAKDVVTAQARFQEALLPALNVLENIQRERESDRQRTDTQMEQDRLLEGRAFWLRARSLRGQALATQLSEGKQIPVTETGEPVEVDQVLMTWIPDPAMQKDAVASVREAAWRIPDSLPIQKAAVDVEIQYDPARWYWHLIPTYAGNLLKLDPGNERARYLMASYEFMQPVPRPGNPKAIPVPSPLSRRSKDRMVKALEHVTKLKEAEGIKSRWRTLYLEAQIHQWLLGYYKSPLNPQSPAQQVQHEVALRTILFDPATGIRKKAEQDDRISKMSRLDVDGLMGLHQMALDRTLDDVREATRPNDREALARLVEALDATLALCQRIAAQDDTPTLRLGEITEAAVVSVARAQPFLAIDQAQTWQTYLDAVQSLTQKAMDRKAATPATLISLTEMLGREAELAEKQNQSSRRAALLTLIEQWIDKGLKYGEAQKIPPSQLLNLHEQAARMKTLGSGKREDVAPHVRVMMESTQASSRAMALLLDGMLAEREGRLEHAQQSLEHVLQLERAGPNASRAHMLLANVYLALGKPDQALKSLAQVRQAYQQFDKLSDEEKAWAKEFVRSENDLALMEFQAHLQTAQMKYADLSRQAAAAAAAGALRPVSSGRPTVTARPISAGQQAEPFDPRAAAKKAVLAALKPHENAAAELMKRFPQHSPMERVARQLEVGYFASTGRLPEAQRQLDALKKDYPDSVQVLRQEIELVALTHPKDRIERTDAIIQDYVKNFPREKGGKLLWAEWLISSGRPERAASYLEDPSSFAGLANDQRLDGLQVAAYTRLGERDKVLEAVQLLPRDPGTEAMKIRLAGTSVDEMQRQVREEMTRFEANGTLACFNANLSFMKKDYVDAAQGYAKALEFTKVKGTARQGVLNSLMALARENPEKALQLSVDLLQHYPGEPELLMAFAYACLQLDRLGNPKEMLDRPKDMSSALDQMEQAFIANRQDNIAGPLAKAQFWTWSGRPDQARADIKRALLVDPKNDKALLMGARLAVESTDPVDIGIGLAYVKWLKEKETAPAETYLLEGQLLEREGKAAEATTAYETVVDKFPTYQPGYVALVAFLEKQGQPAKANQWIQRWRHRLPNDADVVRAQIRQLANAGQLAEAKKVCDDFLAEQVKLLTEKAAAIKPLLATDAAELEKQRQAIVDARKAAIELTLAMGFIEAKAWTAAEQLVRSVLTRQPDSEEANLRLGDVNLGRLRAEPKSPNRAAWLQQARRSYETVYANHKGHERAGNNLAWILAQEENNPEAALRYLQEVRTGRHSKQLRTGDRLPVELLDTLGMVYRNLDRPEQQAEMRDLFEAARVRYPSDPRMYLHLGNAYAGLREVSKAKTMYAAAITLANQKTRSLLSPEERQAVIDAAKAEQGKLPK